MEKFENEHNQCRPSETLKGSGGNPDQGSGYYSRHLSLDQWNKFNVYQRIFGNSREQLPILMILVPIAGIWLPIPTMIGIWSYNLARFPYAFTYTKSVTLTTGPALNSFI